MNNLTLTVTGINITGGVANMITFEVIGSPNPEEVAEVLESIQVILRDERPILINQEGGWMIPVICNAAKNATIAVKHAISGYVVVQTTKPHLEVGQHLSNESSLGLL